jgi:quinol monooxygenase YgiN
MIRATLKMGFAPRTIDDAVRILLSIIEQVRAETGCMSCSVYQDTGGAEIIEKARIRKGK